MRGHKCSGQVFSLEVVGTDIEEDGDLLLTEEGVVNTFHSLVDEPPLISLNALSRVNTYITMRVKGCVEKNALHVLVDSSSTHNFLDLQIAKKFSCGLRKICPLDVFVATRNVMTSFYECKGFTWVFQWVTYTADDSTLGGYDMLLGIQWLYGLPDSIISDRDKVFLTYFCRSLFKVLKTTPFEDVYGQTPLIHAPYIAGDSVVKATDGILQAREQALNMLKKMKKVNNKVAVYVLVKWSNHTDEDATWELYSDLLERPKVVVQNLEKSQRDDHSDNIPSEISEPRKEYPRTYNEAMQSRDIAFWKKAIHDEIGSIIGNDTWALSDLLPCCEALGIDKFKARLIIQGFRRKEEIDYFDTHALIARITTIRLLLALAAIHNLVIHQMDVKTAFLNGDLMKKCI
nr:zinc finger, CCHC-type [Tanacetum cinerariifolium]